MLENIEINCHSSIKIKKSKIIYIDPYEIEENNNDADLIFITHGHYDHFSEEDIRKVKNKDTIIIITEDVHTKALKLGFNALDVYVVKPNEKYKIKNIEFETIPSYNTNKSFHPKENEWVGYIIRLDGITYYIAGDTDITGENKKVKCDIAFVPVRRNIYNGF
ncbi:MAG: MBL fold metallo-hydrolase [Clostridia bacterium]|nr:MBL fold metallo-hydrolase [Clostridia bacterium]